MALGATWGADMGLLDPTDDPRTMGLLSLGLGLLGSKGSFGNALGQAGPQALQAMRQVKADQQHAAMQQQAQQMQAIQMQAAQQQLAEQQRQAAERERQQQFMQNLPSPQMAANSQALAGGGGPTVANAARAPAVDPMQQLMFGAVKSGALPLSSYIASMQKDETPIALSEGGQLVTRGGKVLANNPKNDAPTAVKEYNFAVGQGYKGTFEQFQTAQKRAGATNVSVSMDKGFGDAFATDAAKMLAASRDKAQGSARTLQTLDRINSAINSGPIVSGPTATPEMVIRQIGQGLGVAGKSNEDTLKRTRDVIQGAAALAVDGAAMLAGQGQITDGERALVGKAAGGNVAELTVPEIRQLTGTLRKINTLQVQQHQDRLKNVDPKFSPFVPFYKVDMPKSEPIDFGSLK